MVGDHMRILAVDCFAFLPFQYADLPTTVYYYQLIVILHIFARDIIGADLDSEVPNGKLCPCKQQRVWQSDGRRNLQS